jgi:isopentenyl-diphosphate delta-isomerase
MDEVVLVNEQDEPVGTMEKMAAHREPHLHRAFSVFLFDNQQKLLLQQRAPHKYHSGGLWTNTCCSHPKPGEKTFEAAKRRLIEELNVDANIQWSFDFIYEANFDNGLYEHEYDHVYIGRYDGLVDPNPFEVAACCYKSLDEIKEDLILRPHLYTAWFKIALPKLEAYLAQNQLPAVH